MVEEEEITAASAAVADDDKKLKVKIQWTLKHLILC